MPQSAQSTKTLVWIVAALAGLALIMSMGMSTYGGFPWSGGWGGMMAFGALWMAIPVVIVVWLVYQMADRRPAAPEADARSVLEARYARGEVSRDEYLRIRDDLEGRRSG